MSNSSDDSNKGPAKPDPDAGPKKPTAVIDLKPTDVDIRNPMQDHEKPQAAAAVAAAAAKAAAARPPTLSAAAVDKAAGAGGAAGAGSAGATPKPGVGTGPSARASAPPLPPEAAATGGGLRAAATHLAAGLAGGLLALIGADALAPSLGMHSGQPTKVAQDLVARVRVLEQSGTRAGPSELGQKLAAAETRLAELERASRAIGELSQQQARLAGETKALGERLAQAPAASPAEERIARLEETLMALAATAAADPQRGRIPQLAAITGKVADLEASLATQIAALRKSVTQEVDSRLSQSAEAASQARSGTQRLDRELTGVKTETAQVSQRVDGLKAQSDRVEITVRGLREEAATLKVDVGTLREDVARELKQVTRPTDVTSALTPLTSKLSLLEQNVQGVVRSEGDRRANVERIVTALELGNLKRTVERGVAFGGELAEVRRVAGPKLDLSVLERYKDKGVPALGELEREFASIAFAIIEAETQPANAHWTDRLLASAKSVVRVRKVDQGADDKGIEATVARMEQGLKSGRLGDVTAEAGKLSEQARAPARPWLEKVEARAAVDRAIAAIEQELKASLGGQSQAGKKG